MKTILFSLRDEQNDFGSVFTALTEGIARRDFAAAVNSGGASAVSFAPADFALYKLGTFDTVTGHIEVEPMPNLVVRGDSLVAEKG